MIHTQRDRGQPKLTDHTLTAYMDMRGFMTIKTIEEKAIGAWNIGNRWHDIRLARFQEARADVATVYLIWDLWGVPVKEQPTSAHPLRWWKSKPTLQGAVCRTSNASASLFSPRTGHTCSPRKGLDGLSNGKVPPVPRSMVYA